MATSASEFKKEARKTITLPSGKEIVIRKVLQGEVTAAVGVPALFISIQRDKDEFGEEVVNERLQGDADEFAVLVKESLSDNLKKQRAVIAYGCVNPKVVLKDAAEDELLPEDFGSDYEFVYDQIVTFSTLSYRLLGVVGEEKFPQDSPAVLSDSQGPEVSPQPGLE